MFFALQVLRMALVLIVLECEVLRWSRGSVLAFGTQVRGFKPGRSRRIFQGEKILSTPSFGRKVKPFVPCRRFTACKRSLNVTWKSGIFRQKSSAICHPRSSSFHYQGLWWRHLAVQVGTTKDQGLHYKPSAAVHPVALAAGTLPQYNARTVITIGSPRGQGIGLCQYHSGVHHSELFSRECVYIS